MLPRIVLVVAGLITLFIGCNRDPYGVAPVSGRVTLDGKQVPKLAVMLQPVATAGNINPGPGSYGVTDADGVYSMKLVGKEAPGAVVGKNKVRMDPYTPPADPNDDKAPRPKAPPIKIPSK